MIKMGSVALSHQNGFTEDNTTCDLTAKNFQVTINIRFRSLCIFGSVLNTLTYNNFLISIVLILLLIFFTFSLH